MQPSPVHPGMVEAALERVLASESFRGLGRLRQFLQYIVAETLAGHSEEIKEYSIGVAVYNRGIHFDPRCDSIVRVEAIKLRQRLQRYYHREGAVDSIIISIPKGGYVPVFEVGVEQTFQENLEEACWRARSLLLSSKADAISLALRHFWKAVREWPSSAGAYAGLAECLVTAVGLQILTPREGAPLVQMAATQALSLGYERGEVYVYAALPGICEFDKSSLEGAVRKALQLDPGNAMAHAWGAVILSAAGRHEDALAHLRQASRLQPLANVFRVWAGVVLYYAQQYQLARRQLLDILELEPENHVGAFWLGRT